MGVTLWCWKWADGLAHADAADVVGTLANDAPHSALGRFDVAAFESALATAVGGKCGHPFGIDRGDFTGLPCNWINLSADHQAITRHLASVFRTAAGFGLVVYHDELGRLLTADDCAAKPAASPKPRPPDRKRTSPLAIVRDRLGLVLSPLGFRWSSGRLFRTDGDRVLAVTPFLSDDGRGAWINVTGGFTSLSQFQNEYRRFYQEPEVAGSAPVHIVQRLPEIVQGLPVPYFDLAGEESNAAMEEAVRAAVGELAESLTSLGGLSQAWDASGSANAIDRASARVLVGDISGANQILDVRDGELANVLKARHHPPSRSEQQEIEFFRRFLRERKA